VTILSRDQLRARLAGAARPAPAIALPTITYNETTTIHMNGEDVRLIPMPVAHTDGDTLVYFPGANVLMTGDFYRSVGYPFPDRANGGSLKGLLDALQAVVDLAKPDTKIIPGHGEIVSRTAVAEHKAMAIVIRDRVAAMVKAGKTADEVVAAKPTADYDAKVPGAATSSERFLRAVHAELSAAK
jgi:glyoxylase-like metal-dependent hydrolase (beta-lactamase superfamily II)